MPPVEQIKAKRSGTGLRALDVDRAFPGFTLFAPQSGGGKVYLIDLEGNVTHTWQMPYPPGNYGYLTERGTFFTTERPPKIQNALSASDLGRAVPRLRSTGTVGFSGRCDTPITITTAYGSVTATCC